MDENIFPVEGDPILNAYRVVAQDRIFRMEQFNIEVKALMEKWGMEQTDRGIVVKDPVTN